MSARQIVCDKIVDATMRCIGMYEPSLTAEGATILTIDAVSEFESDIRADERQKCINDIENSGMVVSGVFFVCQAIRKRVKTETAESVIVET